MRTRVPARHQSSISRGPGGVQDSLFSKGRGTMGDDGEEGSGVMGWVIFILIFGVGNFILYQTTGIVIIPIRR
jgi:hypothetical protein